MRRRSFLGALGAGALGTLAGCGALFPKRGFEDDDPGQDLDTDTESPPDPTSYRRLQWLTESSDSPTESIAVGDGVVLAREPDVLRCLESQGRERWHEAIERESTAALGPVAVYVHGRRSLAALDRERGETVWSVAFEDAAPRAASPLATDARILVARENEVAVVGEGELVWRTDVPDVRDADSADGTVYVTARRSLRTFDAASGEELPRSPLSSGDAELRDLELAGDLVVAVDASGGLHGVPTDGREGWHVAPPERDLAAPPSVLTADDRIVAVRWTLPPGGSPDGPIGSGLEVSVTVYTREGSPEWTRSYAPWRDGASPWQGAVHDVRDVAGTATALDDTVYLPAAGRVFALRVSDSALVGTLDVRNTKRRESETGPETVTCVDRASGRCCVGTSERVLSFDEPPEQCTSATLGDPTTEYTESGRSELAIEAPLTTGSCPTMLTVELASAGESLFGAPVFVTRSPPDLRPGESIAMPDSEDEIELRDPTELPDDASMVRLRIRGTWGEPLDEWQVAVDPSGDR